MQSTGPASTYRPNAAKTVMGIVWPVAVSLGIALLMHFVARPNIDAYNAILTLTIGVNITLAVSLTMVNGFTGQFSMGHAGFLAVGGYVAGIVSYYGSMKVWGSGAVKPGLLCGMPIDPTGLPMFGGGEWLFVIAIISGGLVAAALGYIVGLPSLRLRGDYLAIVTLGFGEIVRVMIQQSGPVLKTTDQMAATPFWKIPSSNGGSLGFGDIPKYSSLFWVYLA